MFYIPLMPVVMLGLIITLKMIYIIDLKIHNNVNNNNLDNNNNIANIVNINSNNEKEKNLNNQIEKQRKRFEEKEK